MASMREKPIKPATPKSYAICAAKKNITGVIDGRSKLIIFVPNTNHPISFLKWLGDTPVNFLKQTEK